MEIARQHVPDRLRAAHDVVEVVALLEFSGDRLTPDNWEAVYDAAAQRMCASDWAQQVLTKSRIEAVFLTNDFDDPLTGFDTQLYVPCLRTDDLVLRLHDPATVARLRRCTGVDVQDLASLKAALGKTFERFVALLGGKASVGKANILDLPNSQRLILGWACGDSKFLLA